MNIGNIILQLQEIANASDDALELLILSKAIQSLKVGSVTVVSSTANLPTLPLDQDGQLYLVENDSQLYYNYNEIWYAFPITIVGIAYGWGSNNVGQLGVNDLTNYSSPTFVVGDLGWSYISAGRSLHSLGIRSDGQGFGWGYNVFGNLGTGNTSSSRSPVQIVGGLTWSKLSAGSNHSLGLTSDGAVYVWGWNFQGQLGTGNTISYSSPVTVAGGITNWIQVSAGDEHSLGLTADGIVYTWGEGLYGKLGTGDTISYSSPVTVVGGLTWSQISAGDEHSLGIADGIAYSWGYNNRGQLGTGDTLSRTSPATVIGGITNWIQVSAGDEHSLGLTADGIVYTWGEGLYGKLGTGNTTYLSSPATIVGGITNWSQISAAGDHSLGLTSDGIVYAWGRNDSGQLGTGDGISYSSPVTVVGGITTWSQVSAGNSWTLSLRATELLI